mgnify:CR=1 FL=1|jgi:hypothetical protein
MNITSARYLYSINNEKKNIEIVVDGITKSVPMDEANSDYQVIKKWIADGGTVIDNGGGE